MSGGAYNYNQQSLAYDLFGWGLNIDYGEDGRKQSKLARKVNPMNDRDISEIVWDVLCLIQSRDWEVSGDTCEDTYKADIKAFKRKWMNRKATDMIEAYKEDLRLYYTELLGEMECTTEP